jgi:hypothetical protein
VRPDAAKCHISATVRHLKSWKRPLGIRLGIRPAVTAARQMLACAIVAPKREYNPKANRPANDSLTDQDKVQNVVKMASSVVSHSLPEYLGTSSISARRKQSKTGEDMKALSKHCIKCGLTGCWGGALACHC